jgi:hypothetical protein
MFLQTAIPEILITRKSQIQIQIHKQRNLERRAAGLQTDTIVVFYDLCFLWGRRLLRRGPPRAGLM